jgi:uncharacterized tellurite resistance protein B-like protein
MPTETTASESSAALALFVLLVVAGAWIGLRMLVRSLRSRKAEATVGSSFGAFALEALVNAARIDGRVAETEKRAILAAMRQIEGETYEAARVETAFAQARLSKNELVAYLAQHARQFSRDQKAALLKSLLSVFVADNNFDETEHAALVDYTEAVGFDRQSAPDMLRSISRQFTRGSIT